MYPLNSIRITQPFADPGYYASISDSHGPAGHHTGIDYGGYTGMPVFSCLPGRVVISDYNSTMGNWVGVYNKRHNVTITYWHLSSRKVRVGQRVRKAQVIGRMGSTGNSTGPHLHLQANYGAGFSYSGHINPARWVGGRTPRQYRKARRSRR